MNKIAWLPLTIGIVLTLVLSLYPFALAVAGKADHAAATLAFWSMSAGYIRGVGFVPRHRVPRWLFSGTACYAALAAAAALLAFHGAFA